MKKKDKFRTDTRTNEVKVHKIDRHKDYQFERYSFRKIGKSGLRPTFLTIAALKSKIKSLPEFIFRWDEKVDELDVDILNVTDDVKRMFKNEKEGYRGHHTKRIPDSKGRRIFKALIEIPVKGKILKIFQGDIIFGLCRELRASIRIKLSTRASLKVIHQGIKRT